MSRQRLGFASGQRKEVVETLIGSGENGDVIEILPRGDSLGDPNILMSVIFVPRSRFDLTRIRPPKSAIKGR
jgi:hypothetical protein